ncbi:LLM class flavin-dependent oxidoreductase [Nakamurella sp. PAMC28650]|uniref:LLM class flavin-dependent oxidoreductase n=1 Tax=Nakamurella sp. PAMC28650 TaxID=2762325 RepID=UPI00164E81CD|nr:LLM class flavin-dependent oxidoreductase [Nakamurella sp. PAMC28650]QNK80529.1 LLM class flavin-dependent oxidoreductase [Nakamurella sp. PAMC28650]
MNIPLSILDLAPINKGQSVGEGIAASVALAQRAEAFGYRRVWYAEHHNMSSIASSATSVLIAHIAANTSTIRLGAGGVMLPNHSPLTIAEQFGTLASIHPGRIDLGLGRAPGSDQMTARAMRRDPGSSDRFPDDVLELQGYLSGKSLVPGVTAVPGQGTEVPLYILGSSLFGAQLAAAFGLPFAFASHFAPASLMEAMAIYRRDFQPGAQLTEPYAFAALNVIAADSAEEAERELHLVKRARVSLLYGRSGRTFTDEEADLVIESDAGRQIEQMVRYSAVGTASEVRNYLDEFAELTGADELITAHQASTTEFRLRSVELTADAMATV